MILWWLALALTLALPLAHACSWPARLPPRPPTHRPACPPACQTKRKALTDSVCNNEYGDDQYCVMTRKIDGGSTWATPDTSCQPHPPAWEWADAKILFFMDNIFPDESWRTVNSRQIVQPGCASSLSQQHAIPCTAFPSGVDAKVSAGGACDKAWKVAEGQVGGSGSREAEERRAGGREQPGETATDRKRW